MRKLQVLVKPNAKTNSWGKGEDGQMWLRVAAPPAEGKANEACIAYLAEILQVPKSKISLVKGHTGRLKTFAIGE